MTLNVGDYSAPTLTVSPFDGTTVATLTVIDPEGAETSLTPTTADAGNHWTAPAYQHTRSGEWVERWSVSGTGAGRESIIRYVEPQPPAPTLADSYATTADWYDQMGSTGPANLRVLLRRASRDVDSILLTSVYDITDPDVASALMRATCEQVAFRLARGETDGMPTGVQSVAIGSVQLSRGYSTGKGESDVNRFSEQAFQILRNAGLTGHAPQTEAGVVPLGPDAPIMVV